MSGSALATYLVAITLLTITPGVDTLLVLRNTARGGWRDGLLSSLGICCGLFVHGTLSAVGISLLLVQATWAFAALKLAGAAYLVWLGLSSWRGALGAGRPPVAGAMPRGGEFLPRRSLREGFFSNVLNPKTAVFYMAFLPQFIDPAGSALRQSLALAGGHFVIAMLWQGALTLLVDRARNLVHRPRLRRVLGGLTGSILVLLGLRLAAVR